MRSEPELGEEGMSTCGQLSMVLEANHNKDTHTRGKLRAGVVEAKGVRKAPILDRRKW